jgi:hypothetical protein
MPPENSNEQMSALSASTGHLRQFETVVAKLLPIAEPRFMALPPLPDDHDDNPSSYLGMLPRAARVYGCLEGQLSDPARALRKEQQLESILRCIRSLLPKTVDSDFTIVDFGGGSGHLGITLALHFPHCRIVVVDLGERHLKLLHEKAWRCNLERKGDAKDSNLQGASLLSHSELQQTAISNLYTFFGSVELYNEPFHMGIALHLCGEATDVALRLCGTTPACQSLVFAPCCVGKLNADKKNPYVYQATGSDIPTVIYPQSSLFCQYVGASDWNALAKAADYGDMTELRTPRNASRRAAKALLETDRRIFLEQTFGFETILTRMHPWEATPKHDIIIGWRGKSNSYVRRPDEECNADILLTIQHLSLLPATNDSSDAPDTVDWSKEEENDIRDQINNFLDLGESVFVFPTYMGRRRRKLIHAVAEEMKLKHWSVGRKYGEKTVAVSRIKSLVAAAKG